MSVLEKQVKISFPPLNRVTNSSGFLGDLAAVLKTLYLQGVTYKDIFLVQTSVNLPHQLRAFGNYLCTPSSQVLFHDI